MARRKAAGDGDQPPKRKRKAKRRPQPRGEGGRFAPKPKGAPPPAPDVPPAPDDPSGLGDLDLTDGRDRQLFRRCISRGWKLHGEDLQRAHGMLHRAAGIAEIRGDERAMRGCVDLWLRIAAQVQSDEQLDAKLAAGAGLEGQTVTIRVVRED